MSIELQSQNNRYQGYEKEGWEIVERASGHLSQEVPSQPNLVVNTIPRPPTCTQFSSADLVRYLDPADVSRQSMPSIVPLPIRQIPTEPAQDDTSVRLENPSCLQRICSCVSACLLCRG